MTYSIRMANTSDIPDMCHLMHEAFSIYSDPPSSALDETISSITNNRQQGEQAALLFDNTNTLLAMIRFVQTDKTISFHRFAVKPSIQGKGLGSLLLTWLEDYAVYQDVLTLTCKVRKNLSQNISFYEKNGYQQDNNWTPSIQHSTPVLAFTKSITTTNKKKTRISSY